MSHKPKHPCAWPVCPELVEAGERYCPEHVKQAAKDYEKYKRDPNTSKRYGTAWKKIRKRYITWTRCDESSGSGDSKDRTANPYVLDCRPIFHFSTKKGTPNSF